VARELDLDLQVHINPECVELGFSPFTHDSAVHTDQWKTQALKQAIDKSRFDVGGPLRLPVPWVNRPHLDSRGSSGLVVGGSVRVGQPIRVVPRGARST
jgi:hypothetical protein